MTTQERALLYMLEGKIDCPKCRHTGPPLSIEQVTIAKYKNEVRVRIRCRTRQHLLGVRIIKLNELRYAEETRPWQSKGKP